MARIPKALLQTSNDAVPTKPVLDQLDADAVVDPVVNDALSMDVSIPDDVLADLRARDIQDNLNIPEDEITAWHGTPNDLPPVTELVSLAHGGRVLVDKNQFPDWTKHPDLKPGDYEFVKDHPLGKFDSEKIGTGEGAQAYGHGLYFAQRKGTAESYQTKLTTAKIDKGSLLEVKIKAREDEFLNFDEVLDETDQTNIMSLLENNEELSDFVDLTYNSFTESGYNPTGMNLLKAMEESYEPQDIAKVLSDAGIKGIKYKDAQTRFSAKGATYNYVVFDDN